jgi:hypothetical protein
MYASEIAGRHLCMGVEPVESFAFTSAPFASSARMILGFLALLACNSRATVKCLKQLKNPAVEPSPMPESIAKRIIGVRSALSSSKC